MVQYIVLCGTAISVISCFKKDEKTLFDNAEAAANHSQWTEAAAAYRDVVASYPDGVHAAISLFKIGVIEYSQLKDFRAAAATLETAAGRYPTSSEAPKALMTLGFLFANETAVKNLDSARKYYGEIVSQYPSDELAGSAQMEIQYLGEPPEMELSNAPVFTEKPFHDSLAHAPSAQALAH